MLEENTILVVDTRQDVVNKLSGILREEGYRTLTASSDKKLLEQLRGNIVCLIIAHGVMRGLWAEEFLEKAGKSSFSPLRIIVADMNEVQKKYSEGNENEICWFIAEPCEKEVLLFTVRNALKCADLLSKNEALLETVSVLAAREISFEEKLQKILTISLAQISAEKGSIMLRDEQGDLIVKAATNQQLIGVKRCLEDEKRASVWVVRNGRSLFVKDIKKDVRFKPSEETAYKKDNFLCVPIKNEKGAIIGVFNVTDKRDGGLFTSEDEHTLLAFIGRVAMLIENAQLKEDLEEERDRLKRKNKEITELEQVKEDLVNMIVHDLKNPLGEIMANLDLLCYGDLKSQDREYLDTAIHGSERLLGMILNVLDVRRLEDGKLALHGEALNVRDVIEDVVKKHKTVIQQKEIEAKVVIDENVSTWIADRSLIERVLGNLLANAIGYSHRGGAVEITGSYLQKEKQLRVEVKDNGKGIPGEFQQRVFDKFCQLDSDSAYRNHSTGLGLTFCKMAIEAHHGKIWVESEEGKGSKFIFLLPLEREGDLI